MLLILENNSEFSKENLPFKYMHEGIKRFKRYCIIWQDMLMRRELKNAIDSFPEIVCLAYYPSSIGFKENASEFLLKWSKW